ncbi:MAG: response regulator [Actinomycetota bacterium]
MSAHILVVDDDAEICRLVTGLLEREGFRATAVGDGVAMRHALAAGGIDLVVLDLMLPGEDGLSLCRDLRARTDLPVIMLTAKGTEGDRVAGLETGADDYLAKPFGAAELLARIRAVLRRARPRQGSEVLCFAGWRLDTVHRRLTSAEGVLVELTGAEYDLLLALLRHCNQVLDRDRLLELTRGRLAGPEDRTIDVQVGKLRRKLEPDPKAPTLIKTVRGGGYVLAAEVRSA